MRQIEEQTQENLQKISFYNNSISKELSGIDTKLDQIIRSLQLDFYNNYQTWIKYKEKEFKDIILQYKERQEKNALIEIKNKELTQKLLQEEEKRMDLLRRRDKIEQDYQNMKKLMEKIKDDALNYKQQAMEDKRKQKVLESQNLILDEKVQSLKGKLREEKHQSSLILLNNSTLQNQQSLLFGDGIDNQGNQTKFKAFLDGLFQNDLRPPEIKQELLSFFNTLEMGYRDRIFKLQQKLKEAIGRDDIPSQSKVNPNKSSIIIEKPQIESQKGALQQSPRIQYENTSSLKLRTSRNQQARNKSQMVNSSFIHNKDQMNSVLQSSQNMNINPIAEDKLIIENKYAKRSIQKNYFNHHSNLIAGANSSRYYNKMNQDRSPSSNNVFPKLDIMNTKEEGDKMDPLTSFRSRLSKFNERKFTNSALRGSNQIDTLRKLEIK